MSESESDEGDEPAQPHHLHQPPVDPDDTHAVQQVPWYLPNRGTGISRIYLPYMSFGFGPGLGIRIKIPEI